MNALGNKVVHMETCQSECVDQAQSERCRRSSAQCDGTSRALRRSWWRRPALPHRLFSGQTLPPPHAHQRDGLCVDETFRPISCPGVCEAEDLSQQAKVLGKRRDTVRSRQYPAVGYNGPSTEVRASLLQGNLRKHRKGLGLIEVGTVSTC